jgi:hypothetical protein
MKIAIGLLLLPFALTACHSTAPQDWRSQGTVEAPTGGAPGYQHGPQRSKFVVGEHARREQKFGYLKSVGDQGTLATSISNGSALALPSHNAASLTLPPFGKSPNEHDAWVKDYFLKLGLPSEQVVGVRGMSMIDAHGRASELGRSPARVTAYYSALQRTIDGVPVPDSFAWARVNSRGDVVQEGVYWPALPASVLSEARQLQAVLAEPERLAAYKSRLPLSAETGTVAIRHSAATSPDAFECFASFDVLVHSSRPLLQNASAPATWVDVTRHFDIDGKEHFLPQERLDLSSKYPADKRPAALRTAQ